MLELNGNLFNMRGVICITTNGFVKANGRAVMGRGCALQASKLHTGLSANLGSLINLNGNTVQIINDLPLMLSFPVKHSRAPFNGDNVVEHMKTKFKKGDIVPGWALKASPELIVQSALKLVDLTDTYGWESIFLPRPGCGAGELNWTEIKPLLNEILDNRFHSVTY
jgi:hypothetical protein|tara:strand:+ start:579 stop:1079 length:501 start_codon:yes stop_codon:yes gene_type:complete